MVRYIAERSGAVLDTKTGLREWFPGHNDAIVAAERKNDPAYEEHIEQDPIAHFAKMGS